MGAAAPGQRHLPVGGTRVARSVCNITLDLLAHIGNDTDARFKFFRRFVESAREIDESPSRHKVLQ